MATEETTRFRTNLEKVLEVDVEKLCREDLPYKLIDSRPHFLAVQNWCTRLRDDPYLDSMPREVLKDASGALETLRNKVYTAIANLRDGPDLLRQRDAIRGEFESALATAYRALTPMLAYSYTASDHVSALRAQSAAAQEELNQDFRNLSQANDTRITKLEQKSNEQIEKMEELIRIGGETLSAKALSVHQRIFLDAAKEHARGGYAWLVASVAAFAVTLMFAHADYSLAKTYLVGMGPAEAIFYGVVPKLIVISVLASATVWCVRTYRAHRHNHVVNMHRYHALGTFEAFAAGTQDSPDTRNALLLQAAQAIFSPQPTGYSGGGQEPSTQPQILEIFRGASGGGG